jgi:hypothetical protein
VTRRLKAGTVLSVAGYVYIVASLLIGAYVTASGSVLIGAFATLLLLLPYVILVGSCRLFVHLRLRRQMGGRLTSWPELATTAKLLATRPRRIVFCISVLAYVFLSEIYATYRGSAVLVLVFALGIVPVTLALYVLLLKSSQEPSANAVRQS